VCTNAATFASNLPILGIGEQTNQYAPTVQKRTKKNSKDVPIQTHGLKRCSVL